MPETDTLETLAVGSVAEFITTAERMALLDTMDAALSLTQVRDLADGARTTTIHEIPGKTAEYTKQIYEPAGRLEVTTLPDAVVDVLDSASVRALPLVRTYAPSVEFARAWTYVEYGPGQFIATHLDRVAPSSASRPLQVVGISVPLNDDTVGGEFYVETTSDLRLWSQERMGPLKFARTGADISSIWFNEIPRTRWIVQTRAGDALIYGAHVAHGTLPVRAGRLRKFISWYARG